MCDYDCRRLAKLSAIANNVLRGSLIVCILALLYFLYHYAWTKERHFDGFIGPVLHYFLPAFLAVLFIACLRSSPGFKIKFTAAWVLTCVSIYSIELMLAFTNPNFFPTEPTIWIERSKQELKENVVAAAQYGLDFDTRSRLEFITDLRQKGIRAVPAIQPLVLSKQHEDGTSESIVSINGTNILPLTGIRNRVTVFCNEGKYVIYESDRYGFHNPNRVWDSARVDIAALGDSQTHGACVPSEKNFVASIRRHYPATLNLGVSGQGPLLMLATLKEYAQHVRPKKVLWFFFEGNDFTDLRTEKKFPLLMRYLDRDFSQELLHLGPDIDRVLEEYTEQTKTEIDLKRLPGSLKTILKLSNVRQHLYGPGNNGSADRSVNDDEIELIGKILSEAKFTVEGWKGSLYFVYLPGRERYADWRRAGEDEKNRQRILRVARSIGLPVIDVRDVFESQRDPLDLFSLRRFRHYNETGHRLIAKNVLESLSSPPGEKP